MVAYVDLSEKGERAQLLSITPTTLSEMYGRSVFAHDSVPVIYYVPNNLILHDAALDPTYK